MQCYLEFLKSTERYIDSSVRPVTVMQKFINTLAILSFAVSAGVVAGGTYVYLNKDALTEQAKERVTEAVTSAIGDALGGLGGGLTPEVNSDVPSLQGDTTTSTEGVPNVPF